MSRSKTMLCVLLVGAVSSASCGSTRDVSLAPEDSVAMEPSRTAISPGPLDAALNDDDDRGGATISDAAAPSYDDGPTAKQMRRLTTFELSNALASLLEPRSPKTAVESDSVLLGYSTVGASLAAYTELGVERLEGALLRAVDAIMTDPARREMFLGCLPSGPTDACIRTFLSRFGRRAWRRPMEPNEIARYARLVEDLVAQQLDIWSALSLTVTGMLQSPYFVYRVEVGEPELAGAGGLRYTNYEMASRLSFFLLGSAPDDALLDQAERGELVTDEGLRSAVTRLLLGPAFKPAVQRFFYEFLELAELDAMIEAGRDTKGIGGPSSKLGRAFLAEMEELFGALATSSTDSMQTMFNTRTTYVDSYTAPLYGLALGADAGLTRMELPADSPRLGFLTRGAFLTTKARGVRTSPTLRGRFVRNRLLCQHIPDPPADVVAVLFAPPEELGPQTVRQRLALHASSPACKGCHNLTDPIGFAFEHLDAIGRWRPTEDGLPIDSSGDLDGKPFSDPLTLMQVLSSDDRTMPCMARQAYRYAIGRPESEEDEQQLAAIARSFASNNHRWVALLEAIVMSAGFRHPSSAATPKIEGEP
jgi:hypothetical protein